MLAEAVIVNAQRVRRGAVSAHVGAAACRHKYLHDWQLDWPVVQYGMLCVSECLCVCVC